MAVKPKPIAQNATARRWQRRFAADSREPPITNNNHDAGSGTLLKYRRHNTSWASTVRPNSSSAIQRVIEPSGDIKDSCEYDWNHCDSDFAELAGQVFAGKIDRLSTIDIYFRAHLVESPRNVSGGWRGIRLPK